MYLVGTKSDKLTVLDEDKFKDFIDYYEVKRHLITSSATGEGVDELFEAIGEDLANE